MLSVTHYPRVTGAEIPRSIPDATQVMTRTVFRQIMDADAHLVAHAASRNARYVGIGDQLESYVESNLSASVPIRFIAAEAAADPNDLSGIARADFWETAWRCLSLSPPIAPGFR